MSWSGSRESTQGEGRARVAQRQVQAVRLPRKKGTIGRRFICLIYDQYEGACHAALQC